MQRRDFELNINIFAWSWCIHVKDFFHGEWFINVRHHLRENKKWPLWNVRSGHPYKRLAHLVKGFFHGGWFIHGRHHFRKTQRWPPIGVSRILPSEVNILQRARCVSPCASSTVDGSSLKDIIFKEIIGDPMGISRTSLSKVDILVKG